MPVNCFALVFLNFSEILFQKQNIILTRLFFVVFIYDLFYIIFPENLLKQIVFFFLRTLFTLFYTVAGDTADCGVSGKDGCVSDKELTDRAHCIPPRCFPEGDFAKSSLGFSCTVLYVSGIPYVSSYLFL